MLKKYYFTTLFLFFFSICIAQKSTNKETIYYLVDTLHADKMVSIENAGNFEFYTVNCACLTQNNKPVFRSNKTNQAYLTLRQVKKIKFWHLPDLIELVRKNDDENFYNRFAIYFVSRSKRIYIKQQVFFIGGKANIMN